MRFTTIYYLFFFALVFLTYWALPRRHRPAFVFAASLVFYAAWSWKFSIHLLIILAINYFFLKRIFEGRSRQLLIIIIALNVANLFLFKYFYFFLETLPSFANVSSESFNSWLLNNTGIDQITLPLAISFYTFQLIGLQVDAYRGNIPERPTPVQYLMFSMYFPHFVAGPIMRHSDFFHQIDKITPDSRKTFEGLFLIAGGLIKKIAIADNVDPVLRPVFANPDQFDASTNFLAAVGFALRIYCDFSGYTDIARGSSKLLGLEIPENFKAPFLSKTVAEFWTRWHITLMMWLRDYIYIPLGGSRRSPLRNLFNLNFTMFLSGIWHGANYTFTLWGLYNGIIVSIERFLFGKQTEEPARGWKRAVTLVAGIVYVQVMFSMGMVLFNAHSFSHAMTMYAQMFTLAGGQHWNQDTYILHILIIVYLLNVIQLKARWEWVEGPWKRYAASALAGLLVMFVLGAYPPGTSDFIYFQF